MVSNLKQGVFSTFRSFKGKFLLLDEHMMRIYLSLVFYYGHEKKDVFLQIFQNIRNRLKEEALKSENTKDYFIRVVVEAPFASWAGRGSSENITKSDFSLFQEELSLSESWKGLKLKQSKYTHLRDPSWPSYLKGIDLNYLGHELNLARKEGFDDIYFLSREKHFTEASTSNLFFLRSDNTFVTPPLSGNVLAGITRSFFIFFLRELGYKVFESEVHIQDIESYEGGILTSSIKQLRPIFSLDHYLFPNQFVLLGKKYEEFLTYHLKSIEHSFDCFFSRLK